jgi:hypothetical protein
MGAIVVGMMSKVRVSVVPLTREFSNKAMPMPNQNSTNVPPKDRIRVLRSAAENGVVLKTCR